jgi:transcriptional regulator with GAF, ATPase, and Fis domain
LGNTDEDLAQLMENIPATNEDLKQVKKEIRQKAVGHIERKFVLQALMASDWNVTQAARQTGLKRSNFQTMMRKYNIKRPTEK